MTSTPPESRLNSGRHRFLLRVERLSRGHYKLVFLIALLAVVAGSFLGSRLRLESDILALMPAGNRQVDAFRKTLADFGSIDYLVVLLESDAEGPEDLEDFADVFARRLGEHQDLIEFVEYRFQPDADFLELFYENALLFLPPERLPELAAKLTDKAIEARLQEHRLTLSSPTAPFAQDLILSDPLELLPLFLNRLVGNRGALQIDLSDGYYLSRDGHTLIMLIKPHGPSQNLHFSKSLLETVRGIEQETREELAADEDEPSDVRARYGGNYAVAVDETALIRQDVKFNLLFSLFAVSALYWLCYRRFAALLYSSLPLLVGQALTFILAFFVLQQLNVASSAFTALLMGLGTDFVIVVYARYIEERRAGKSLAQATELMIGETGLGVFTGAITSAGTFYAMCITQFRGLLHLGFLIGSGILLCAAAILFMLPAMITWNEGVRPRKVDAIRKLHLQSFFLERLIPFSARHRAVTIVSVLVLTAGSLVLASRIEFDGSMDALRSDRSKAHQVQKEIRGKFGASLSYMMAVAEAPTEAEALELTAKITTRLQGLIDEGLAGSYDSVLTYLPPEANQRAVMRALREDTTGAFDPERIEKAFRRGLERAGFREEAFAGFVERMRRFLRPERPISLADLEGKGLGRLLERYVRHDPERTRIVTYIFLSDPRWTRRAPPGLVETLTAGEPGIVVTGTNVVGHEFRRIFTRESRQAVALGFVVVALLLWIDFRSLKLTAIALSQLVCGVIMMLGLMKLADIKMNYVNAFVATMILGVGIDYSIHLVHRFSLSGGRVEAGLLETGKAVVMAALTNIAGFGTLSLGNYPALQSFGKVALFGSITCLFTALTLVPAIMGRSEPET